MRSLYAALIGVATAACASGNMGPQDDGTHFPGEGRPLPHVTQEEFTLVQAGGGDAETVLGQIGIVSNVPAEVSVMTVTSALVQGDHLVSGCIVGAMNSPVELRDGDRLDISWMPQDLIELPDGFYNQQISIRGNIPYYELDGYAHPARSEVFLAWDYRPFEVSDGSLRLVSDEEYGAAQPGGAGDDRAVIEAGGESTTPDLSPTDCEPSDVAVTAKVTPADAP
jgi:hypothetical protein